MSFDPLLTLLGLTAFASATDPAIYTPTAARAGIRIASAALPSTPGIGDLAIDSGAGNALKWWNGSAWQTAGGGVPAGADTQIQYNNAGAFGASADLTFSAAAGLYALRAGAGVAPSSSTYLNLGGATTAIAPLRIGQSASVPAAPTNGDVWLTANNLFLRRNGGTSLLVEHAITTTTGQIPAWSISNGVLGAASGLTWASGGGGQTLTWTAGTRTSSPVIGFTSSMTLNAVLGAGVTSSFNPSLTAGGNGSGSATAISTPLYSLLTANINTAVDNVGCRHVGFYAEVNSTPPSFGWARDSTFVGTLSRITFTSAANDTNRPFYRMIGNDVELNVTLSGTSGTTGVVDSVIGLRVNPQTFSVGTGRTTTVNYYGIRLGVLTTSGGGTFNVFRYGIYQEDTAARNVFLGTLEVGSSLATNTNLTLGSTLVATRSRMNTAATTAGEYAAGVFGRADCTANGLGGLVGVYGMARNSTAGDGTLYGLYADSKFTTVGGSGLSSAVGLGLYVSSAVTTAGKTAYGISGTVTSTGASNASSVIGISFDIIPAASSTTVAGIAFYNHLESTFTGTTFVGLKIIHDMYGSASTSATTVRGVDLHMTVNQGSTLGYTGFYLDVTETAVGSGAKRLLDLNVGGVAQFYVDNVGNAKINTAGSGLFIKEGSNAKMGTATLVAGTVTVSTTAVGANSRIFISTNADGGTPGWVRVSARSAGASFTITSSDGADTSSVAWMIVDPA